MLKTTTMQRGIFALSVMVLVGMTMTVGTSLIGRLVPGFQWKSSASRTVSANVARNKNTTSSCGNQVIEGKEKCDDGNRESGDGCSKKCFVEKGWSCGSRDGQAYCFQDDRGLKEPMAKKCIGAEQRVKAIFDGPGKAWPETPCCTGLVLFGNGDRTYTCTKAGNGVCDPGETYMTSGGDCKCGNQMTDPGEVCDLGFSTNGKGRGCAADCKTTEPGWQCTGGGPSMFCKQCGDGILDDIPYTYIHEQCDDGNNRNGDGCSASCKVER